MYICVYIYIHMHLVFVVGIHTPMHDALLRGRYRGGALDLGRCAPPTFLRNVPAFCFIASRGGGGERKP